MVASYHRYMGTFFMFWVIGMFYMLITILHKEEWQEDKKRKRGLLALCIAMVVVIAGLTHPTMLNVLGTRRLENVYREESVAHAKEIQDVVGTEAKVYLIYQKSRGYTFMGTRYQLGTNPANLGTWSLGEPYSKSDTWTVDLTPQEFFDRLIELDYEYVYIGGGDDQLWDGYGMLFDKPDSNHKVFKVMPESKPPLVAVD